MLEMNATIKLTPFSTVANVQPFLCCLLKILVYC